VFITICSKSVSICYRFHAKLVNIVAEIAHFKGLPKFDALVQRTKGSNLNC